tara:strand:- start:1051 stop:1326 length:276 start_codon:yes stop_codon:yes gene_type:complete
VDCADDGPVDGLWCCLQPIDDHLPSLRLNWLWTTLSEPILCTSELIFFGFNLHRLCFSEALPLDFYEQTRRTNNQLNLIENSFDHLILYID